MLRSCVIFLVLVARDCSSQDDEGPYKGKHIGKLNSYHHQVSGEVYAVDDWTLLLVDFNYDGTGDDTFFWAGDSGRPGPLGFIVPDQHGKTNILERYNNEEIRLRLPDGKRVSRITWFAVYDLASQAAFGDVYVPEQFAAPAPRALPPLAPAPAAAARLSSGPLTVHDANTIIISDFRFTPAEGEEVYFWTGVGPQPSSRGTIIPDEDGYLEPLRAYGGGAVRLRLPGGRSVFEVDWVALWDARAGAALGAALVPDALNVPPAARRLHDYATALPHCKQLHRDLQVSWEVFGNQITFQLAGLIDSDEYMAFGISGSTSRSQMLGADVAVAHYDDKLQRGEANDYNITDLAPCVQVLGAWRGVCRDTRLGGVDSNQVLSAARLGPLTAVSYRRNLQPDEAMDLPWAVDRAVFAVWAVGRRDHTGEPAFHRLYPAHDLQLVLARTAPHSDCVPFVMPDEGAEGGASGTSAWERAQLFEPALRVLRVSLGAAGGRRGLAGRVPRRAAPHLALYVNGQLAPDLQLRRGLTYTFRVWSGDDPHSAGEYHPLVVTSEAHGGLERLGDAAQRGVRVLAGARATRRNRLSPTAAGPLCVGRLPPEADPRRDAWESFRAFNRSLRWQCPVASAPDAPAPHAAPPSELVVTPNASWPDVVYYHSFTHFDMGGRIYVVDRHRRNVARSLAHTQAPRRWPALALALGLALAARLAH